MECFSYKMSLDRLDLFSLEWRSVRGNLKRANTKCGGNVGSMKLFTMAQPSKTQGCKFRIRDKSFGKGLRQICFTQRVVGIWNAMHEGMVEECPLIIFN